MSRFWEYFAGIVFIALFAWFPLYMGQWVQDAFRLARDGVEKQAQIVRIESKRTSKYGTTTWNYYLQIEERTFVWGFSEPRRIGARLWMLELPDEPDQRMLGRRGDSALDLLLLDAGGGLSFAALMAMACFFAAVVPIIFVLWINYLRRPRWRESF